MGQKKGRIWWTSDHQSNNLSWCVILRPLQMDSMKAPPSNLSDFISQLPRVGLIWATIGWCRREVLPIAWTARCPLWVLTDSCWMSEASTEFVERLGLSLCLL
jgi:hypothetical protein